MDLGVGGLTGPHKSPFKSDWLCPWVALRSISPMGRGGVCVCECDFLVNTYLGPILSAFITPGSHGFGFLFEY